LHSQLAPFSNLALPWYVLAAGRGLALLLERLRRRRFRNNGAEYLNGPKPNDNLHPRRQSSSSLLACHHHHASEQLKFRGCALPAANAVDVEVTHRASMSRIP